MPNYIEFLQLESHEEGGSFRQVYKSADKVRPISDRYMKGGSKQERSSGTLIYFLLEKRRFSAWHRLKSDEVWHYYDGGSPIDIHVINPQGQLNTLTLGNPSQTELASFQVTIEAGCWFAAEVRDKTSFALAGCTVAPGFEYEDFELAVDKGDQLQSEHPEIAPFIQKFLVPGSELKDTPMTPSRVAAPSQRPKLRADDYIKLLHLERHVEGGFFSCQYRSKDGVMPLAPRYQVTCEAKTEEQRAAGTSIYFLLEKQDFSAWHRLKSDEIWHYYEGGSLIDLYVIDAEGKLTMHTLGNPSLTEGASFNAVIKAGCWFAAEVRDKNSFGLVGCTVSPGFEYSDFELANRDTLAAKYPEHDAIIRRLTRTRPVNTSSKSWTSHAIKYGTLALVTGIGLYGLLKSENFQTCVSNIKVKLGM